MNSSNLALLSRNQSQNCFSAIVQKRLLPTFRFELSILSIVIIVTFVGKWIPFRLSIYPQKKQPEHYAANQVVGLSNDSVRLLHLSCEMGSNRYSRLRAYYKGFDPLLTCFKLLNQKLW